MRIRSWIVAKGADAHGANALRNDANAVSVPVHGITGRQWAYVGATLGGAVSIAANVAHSFVPPALAPDGWHPQSGAVVSAVFWPIALLVAIEIIARNTWTPGARWFLVRWLGMTPVAAVAAMVSYRHMSGLLTFYGEDSWTATLGPIAVDGIMVLATGVLIMTGIASGREAPEDEPGPAAVITASTEVAEARTAEMAALIIRVEELTQLSGRLLAEISQRPAQPVTPEPVVPPRTKVSRDAPAGTVPEDPRAEARRRAAAGERPADVWNSWGQPASPTRRTVENWTADFRQVPSPNGHGGNYAEAR